FRADRQTASAQSPSAPVNWHHSPSRDLIIPPAAGGGSPCPTVTFRRSSHPAHVRPSAAHSSVNDPRTSTDHPPPTATRPRRPPHRPPPVPDRRPRRAQPGPPLQDPFLAPRVDRLARRAAGVGPDAPDPLGPPPPRHRPNRVELVGRRQVGGDLVGQFPLVLG